MKLNGTHKFKVSSDQIFNAILNPVILKSCIPGCNSVEYLDADKIKAEITTPIPGLKGPYSIVISIKQRQEPNLIVLGAQEKGTGGNISATSEINIVDELDGAMLTYLASAELEGPVSLANNPVGQGITKSALGNFFKNLEKVLV